LTSDLFAGTYARGGVADAVSGQAWLNAMILVEAALAAACGAEGLVSGEAAEAVARACMTALDGDMELTAIAVAGAEHATPVVPLVNELRARVGPEFAGAVHFGATSQDILDTAAMLLVRDAVATMSEDARSAAGACALLAQLQAGTPVLGRTLLQPALPTTFGQKASVWAATVTDALDSLEAVTGASVAVQMGGAVGGRPPAVGARVAQELGMAHPAVAWHTNRVRIAKIATALGVLAGALGKVARDVTLLAQGEVGEVQEGGPPGRGGSSAMAHKHNPVAAVSVLACTRRVPGLVATILVNMEHEHERAAGAWQAEWGTLTDLLVLTGSASAWAADLLANLELDTERMLLNLTQLAGVQAS
jgi:3-carboxy-cis,cis-muconate cycloisomerase